MSECGDSIQLRWWGVTWRDRQLCALFVSQMSICGMKQNRVLSEAQANSVKKIFPRPLSRVNGWSPPLHPFQAVTCTTYLAMFIVTFGIFIPFLPTNWKYAAGVVSFVLVGWAPGLPVSWRWRGPEPHHAYAVGSVSV